MTIKQTVLKFIYPLLRRYAHSKDAGAAVRINTTHTKPLVSFYSLKATLNNKTIFDFNSLRGKKILLVNVASNCGYTGQYEELEKLSRLYTSDLVVLGFPANDFKGQEPGTDEEIQAFCSINYQVSFPLFAKAAVLPPDQQEVFQWLSSSDKNGWNDQQPSWNFCKYLVDENGILQYIFKPAVSPLSTPVEKALQSSGGNK